MTTEDNELLNTARNIVDEFLPWTSNDGALVLMLAPSLEDEEEDDANALSFDGDGNLIGALVLVYRDPNSGEILNANEQPVSLVPNFARHGEERALNYLLGLSLALSRTTLKVPEDCSLLPMHLFFSDALDDDGLESIDDFALALGSSERLGALT